MVPKDIPFSVEGWERWYKARGIGDRVIGCANALVVANTEGDGPSAIPHQIAAQYIQAASTIVAADMIVDTVLGMRTEEEEEHNPAP